MDPKIAKTIETLIKGTERRTLNWERAQERRAEFRLNLKHGWITVGKWNWTDQEEGSQGQSVDITFANPQGETIDTFTYNTQDSPADYTFLVRLHDAARRNALKVDESLSDILGELENRVKEG